MSGSDQKTDLGKLLSERRMKFNSERKDPDPCGGCVADVSASRETKPQKRKAVKPMKLHLLFEAKGWKNRSRRACPQVAIRLRRPILSTPKILWRGLSGRPITGSLKMSPGGG